MTTIVAWALRGLVALPLVFIQVIWMLSTAPLAAKLAPVVIGAVALWRLPVALMLLAILAPLAGLFELLVDLPFQSPRLYEQLVIAVILAALARGLMFTTSRVAMPGLAFAAVALTSALVTIPAWLLMYNVDPTLESIRSALVNGDLFALTPSWQPGHAALLIVIGVLLALVTEQTIRDKPDTGTQIIGGLMLGGSVAALTNLSHVLELAATRDALHASGVMEVFASARLNTQFDINAAGSMFAMLILAGVSALQRPGWIRWLIGVGLITMAAGGLWLSGSRTAMAATLVVTIAALVLIVFRARPEHRRRMAMVLAGVIVAGAAAVAAYPASRNFAVSSSIDSRLILYKTAVRMWRDSPVTGVGVGTFFTRSSDYGSAEVDKILVRGQTRENAHNYFLQVLAELGVVGVVLYVGLLAAVLWAGVRASVWLAAGVTVFLATSLTGHPQLLANAALPFWIVLGCLAGATPSPSRRIVATQGGLCGVLVVCLIVTAQFRAGRTRDFIALEHGGLGVSLWQTSEDGYRYRIGDDRSAVFVPTGHTMMMPVRLAPGGPASATVDVRVDGVVVNRLVLRSDEWTQLSLSIRNARRRFVELRLSAGPGISVWIGRADAKVLD